MLKLQTELDNVMSKLKNQSETSVCSCGKKSTDKPIVVSTGTNTSDEINQNQNYAISTNTAINPASDSKEKEKVILDTAKADEEYRYDRYDHFLNENSINFPKQFLDIDKEDHSNNITKDINYTALNTNNNVSTYNMMEKNYKLIQTANLITTNNDVTSNSIDTASYRQYMLKVPTMNYTSMLTEEDHLPVDKKRSVKIIFKIRLNIQQKMIILLIYLG